MKKIVLTLCAICAIVSSSFAQENDWKTIVNVGWSPENQMMAAVSHGKWIDNHFFLGMGVSVGDTGWEYYLPAVFVQGRVKIGNWAVTPFIDNKMGFYTSNITTLQGVDGLYWQPTIGVSWKSFSVGITGAFIQSNRSTITVNQIEQVSSGAIGAVLEFSF